MYTNLLLFGNVHLCAGLNIQSLDDVCVCAFLMQDYLFSHMAVCMRTGPDEWSIWTLHGYGTGGSHVCLPVVLNAVHSKVPSPRCLPHPWPLSEWGRPVNFVGVDESFKWWSLDCWAECVVGFVSTRECLIINMSLYWAMLVEFLNWQQVKRKNLINCEDLVNGLFIDHVNLFRDPVNDLFNILGSKFCDAHYYISQCLWFSCLNKIVFFFFRVISWYLVWHWAFWRYLLSLCVFVQKIKKSEGNADIFLLFVDCLAPLV